MSNTFKRHPRTAAEAFPRSTEYACALTRPESDRRLDPDRVVIVACIIALGFLACVLWFGR